MIKAIRKTTRLELFLIAVIVIAFLAVRFIFGGKEDDWICMKGQWVRHGNPSIQSPTQKCNTDNKNDTKQTIVNPASIPCKDQGGNL